LKEKEKKNTIDSLITTYFSYIHNTCFVLEEKGTSEAPNMVPHLKTPQFKMKKMHK